MTRQEILKVAKPILFNTDMVQAILDGRKTETRRAVKPKSPKACGFYVTFDSNHNFMEVYDYDENEAMFESPQARLHIGDYLYVRETWALQQGLYWHKAGLIIDEDGREPHGTVAPKKWRPSIHMPKEATRIFLRVTDVRVERLQDMRLSDCLKEGVQLSFIEQNDLVNRSIRARNRYAGVWDDTVKKSDLAQYGWDANPWVWVITFERVEVK